MAKLNHILLCLILLLGAGTAADQVERKIARREEPQYPEIASVAFRHATSSIRQLPSPFGAKRQEGGRCHSEVSAEPT